MIQIDKNIPIPPRNRQGRNDDKYPIRDLDVGDSFIMPAKNTNTASGYVRAAAKRLGDGRVCIGHVEREPFRHPAPRLKLTADDAFVFGAKLLQRGKQFRRGLLHRARSGGYSWLAKPAFV